MSCFSPIEILGFVFALAISTGGTFARELSFFPLDSTFAWQYEAIEYIALRPQIDTSFEMIGESKSINDSLVTRKAEVIRFGATTILEDSCMLRQESLICTYPSKSEFYFGEYSSRVIYPSEPIKVEIWKGRRFFFLTDRRVTGAKAVTTIKEIFEDSVGLIWGHWDLTHPGGKWYRFRRLTAFNGEPYPSERVDSILAMRGVGIFKSGNEKTPSSPIRGNHFFLNSLLRDLRGRWKPKGPK